MITLAVDAANAGMGGGLGVLALICILLGFGGKRKP